MRPSPTAQSTNGRVKPYSSDSECDAIERRLEELERMRADAIVRFNQEEKILRQTLQRYRGSRYKLLKLPPTTYAEDSGLPLIPPDMKLAGVAGDISSLIERIPVTIRYYNSEFITIARELIIQSGGQMPELNIQFMQKPDGSGIERMVTQWVVETPPTPELIFTLKHFCEGAYGRKLVGYNEEKWQIVQRETSAGMADAGWYGISMSPYTYSNLARGLTVMRRCQKKRDIQVLRDRNPRDWICYTDPSRKSQRTIIQLSEGIYSRDDPGLFQDEWLFLVVNIAYVLAYGKLLPSRNVWFAVYRQLSRLGINQPQYHMHGMKKILSALYDIVLFPVTQPKWAEMYGVRAGSVLLAGPPGTGKTLAVHYLMWQDHPVIFVRITGDKFRHDLQGDHPSVILERIGKIRERAHVKVILLVDDIESLLQSAELVNRFLELMNGVLEGGFLVIGSTNKPWEIDDRIFQPGRFDVVLHVSLPDEKDRIGTLLVHLSGKPFRSEDEKENIIYRIAMQTANWSQRLLWMVANHAGLLAAGEAKSSQREIPLEWHHFKAALSFVKNTNNLKSLQEYDARIAKFISHNDIWEPQYI